MARGWGGGRAALSVLGGRGRGAALVSGGIPAANSDPKNLSAPRRVFPERRQLEKGGSLLSRHNPRDVPALPALPLHLHLSGKRWQGVKKLFFSFLFLCVGGNKMAFKEGVALLMALGTREGTRGCSAVCACGGGAASIYTRCPPSEPAAPCPRAPSGRQRKPFLVFTLLCFFVAVAKIGRKHFA